MRAALVKGLAPPAARHVLVEKAVQTAWWELRRLADRAQPAVRRAFMAAVADVRSVTTLARLEEMVRAGDLAGLQRVLAGEPLEAALRARLAPAVVRLAQDAGQKAVGALPASLRGVARFDLLNPKTVDFLRSYSFGLIRQIGATTREGIRRVVTDAFERGGHPRVQARQIRNMVGLTARQAAAVSGYRAQLLAQGVKQAVADRRAQRYADRLVRRRALNIARTETIRAANVGQQALWDQMADEGLIERDRARKVWIVTPDDRLCEICAAIPGMNPDGVPAQGGEFTTDVGPVPYPPAHPQCRCAVGLEFKDTPAPPQPPDRPPRRPRVRRVRPPVPPRRTTPAEQRRRARLSPEETPDWPPGAPRPLPDELFRDEPPDVIAREVSRWMRRLDSFTRRRYGVSVPDTTEAVVAFAARDAARAHRAASAMFSRTVGEMRRLDAKAYGSAAPAESYERRRAVLRDAMVNYGVSKGYSTRAHLRFLHETARAVTREMERLSGTMPMRGATVVMYPMSKYGGYVYGANSAGLLSPRHIHISTLSASKEWRGTFGARMAAVREGRRPFIAYSLKDVDEAAQTLRHEFAHTIDHALIDRARSEFLYGDAGRRVFEDFKEAVRAAARSEGVGYLSWIRKGRVCKNISEYAMKEWAETWAEAVAYVTGPGYVPGTLPKPVEDVIMRAVRAVKRAGGLGD